MAKDPQTEKFHGWILGPQKAWNPQGARGAMQGEATDMRPGRGFSMMLRQEPNESNKHAAYLETPP